MISVGLVGTGFWAATIHAPSLASSESVELAGIWGRNEHERDRLATRHGVRAFASLQDLIDAVDVVDLAVPPALQVGMAIQAAEAGRHLLLEKPMALSLPDALRLDATITRTEVAAVVFLTRLFDTVRSAWLTEQAGAGHTSAHVEWISAALSEGSPYARSGWRQEGGALWDVGPHILSQLIAVLGPVTSVSVEAHEPLGLSRLALGHRAGATSSVNMTVHGDPSEKAEIFEFWGPLGHAVVPADPIDFQASHAAATSTLLEVIEGRAMPPGSGYSTAASVELTHVLAMIDDIFRAGPVDTVVPVPLAL